MLPCYVSSKGANKKNMALLLNGAGGLVETDQPGYKEKHFPVRTVSLWSRLLRD